MNGRHVLAGREDWKGRLLPKFHVILPGGPNIWVPAPFYFFFSTGASSVWQPIVHRRILREVSGKGGPWAGNHNKNSGPEVTTKKK